MSSDGSPLGVYMLDVGQGDCTFIIPPLAAGEHEPAVAPILFDCADAYVAERFVANHQITRLSAVIASHLDIDHIRGLLPFLRGFFAAGNRVDRVLVALDRFADQEADHNLRALLEQVLDWADHPPHTGFSVEEPRTRDDAPLVVASGTDWRVEVVLPSYAMRERQRLNGGRDPNRVSAVVRVTRAGKAVLIGGDAPLSAWEALPDAFVPAVALRTPHHGGNVVDDPEQWPAVASLYAKVNADAAVVSVGTRNGYGHPIEPHVDALAPAIRRMLCTQITPRCHQRPEDIREDALRRAAGVEWPYRHRATRGHPSRRPDREVPCAASVVACLSEDGELELEPCAAEHAPIVDRALTPLCRRVAPVV